MRRIFIHDQILDLSYSVLSEIRYRYYRNTRILVRDRQVTPKGEPAEAAEQRGMTNEDTPSQVLYSDLHNNHLGVKIVRCRLETSSQYTSDVFDRTSALTPSHFVTVGCYSRSI
jgi:hypothetical protein